LAASESKRRTSHPKLAISTIAVTVVVFVAVGIALEVAFLPKASQPGSVQTTSAVTCQPPAAGNASTPSTPVKTAVDQFVQDFNDRNVQGLSGLYAQDACVTWSGKATGLVGTYDGQGNVRILYGSSIGKTTVLNATISNYNEAPSSPSNVNVTMTIYMAGNSTVVGALNSTVDATQQWAYSGQQWQIVKENWDYLTFNVQNPLSSTTFPQWAAIKAGHNPDLVSEKSFEWHAGPYVAASVYTFMGAILVVGAVEYRKMSRRT